MYIFFLILLGLFLRIINIDKPEGLWNDEYVSWMISATPFAKGFFQEILRQCHMPLYYFYLKLFAYCNDLVLRLTSVIPSLFSIPIMYLVGKEFSKKTGKICAILTTVLPFLVYYSQEVRFYSLLFLESTVLLFFIIRVINDKKHAWIGYILSSLILLLTHVLGFIFVGLSFIYLIYKKKKLTKSMLFFLIASALIVIPFGINILSMRPSSQWWGSFSYTNILFLFSDYLSPILTNHVNAPKIFFYNKEFLFSFLILVPTLFGIYLIIKGIKKAYGLFFIILGSIIITALLAITGNIVFITKYTIEILPVLILLLALGVENRFDKILLFLFIAIQLISVLTPYYPTKALHKEGHKLVGDILNNIETDKVIFTYYNPDRFYRYYEPKSEVRYISKINCLEYLNSPENIIKDVQKGENITLVILDSVSFIPKNLIKDAELANVPKMFIIFSKIRNSLLKEIDKNYKNYKVQHSGSWIVITAEKM